MAPEQKHVLSLMPKFIRLQEGAEKQDSETAAAKRWITAHHDTPNAITDFEGQRQGPLRDIHPGEDVTVDYRREPVFPQAQAHIHPFSLGWRPNVRRIDLQWLTNCVASV